MSVPGAAADDPMEITDESENNDSENGSTNDNDVDTDTDGTTDSDSDSDDQKPRVQRPASSAIREESTERLLGALLRNHARANSEDRNMNNTIESANNIDEQENDISSEDDDPAVKNEDGQTGAGELSDPIVVADDNDDFEMFFPEVNSDSVSSLSPTRDFEIMVHGQKADRMMDDLEAFIDYGVKRDLELEEIEVAKAMEGPREVIVIDGD